MTDVKATNDEVRYVDAYDPPIRLIDLDPSDWEDCQTALMLYVRRVRSLCAHGHAILRFGRFCSDHRVRCYKCAAERTNRWKRARTAAKRADRELTAKRQEERKGAGR